MSPIGCVSSIVINVILCLTGGIIKDLSSKNEAKSRVGMLRAEELLGDGEKTWDESSLKTVQNGTAINRKAFEDLGKPKDEIPSDAGTKINFYIPYYNIIILFERRKSIIVLLYSRFVYTP